MGVVGVSSSYEIAKVSCIMLAMFMNPSTIEMNVSWVSMSAQD